MRLHLYHDVQFGSPYYRKDIRLLVSTEKMTKIIHGMRDIPYERLKFLNIHSLERNRLKG